MAFVRVFLALACALSAAAQITAPIRNKISAGDIASAESILEVHEREKGRDAQYLEGLVWVTRGAALLGDWRRAVEHESRLREIVDARVAASADLAKEAALMAALGSQIEVRAQVLAHERGKKPAVAYLYTQLARFAAPAGLRSRIYKRRNMLALEGAAAPEFEGSASLRGKPVLLFGWAHWCGDCKAQAAALAQARARHGDRVQFVMLTRYYDADEKAERAAIDQALADTYAGQRSVVSTAAMERYGVSSTPTFVLIDAAGRVAKYLPYRLTEAELDRLLAQKR